MIGVACIVWLRSAAEYKTVKALSVNMTTLMTIGIILDQLRFSDFSGVFSKGKIVRELELKHLE